jgi:hypothetical protein
MNVTTDYREDEDVLAFDLETKEDKARDLDPAAAPASIGVYDRPVRKAGVGLSAVSLIGVLVLLVIAYLVLTTLF